MKRFECPRKALHKINPLCVFSGPNIKKDFIKGPLWTPKAANMCQRWSLAFIRAQLSANGQNILVFLYVHNGLLKKASLNVPSREELPRLLFYIMWIPFSMSWIFLLILLLHFRVEASNSNWISQERACVFVLFFLFHGESLRRLCCDEGQTFSLHRITHAHTREKGVSAETQSPHPTWM